MSYFDDNEARITGLRRGGFDIDKYKEAYKEVMKQRQNAKNNKVSPSETKRRRKMGKSIKLELTKFPDATLTEDGAFICIPVPPVNTGDGGIFHAKSGRIYVDTVAWENDEEDEYGNMGSIQLSLSKEAREAGEKGAYIGNIKVF